MNSEICKIVTTTYTNKLYSIKKNKKIKKIRGCQLAQLVKFTPKNLLVSWFDDKELSLRTDVIG